MLTPINSQELQWSEFIANEFNCFLETSNSKNNLIAQNPIGFFSSFKDLDQYLKNNPDLLELEDLGFTLLKAYDGDLLIQLYAKINEIEEFDIAQSKIPIKAQVNYPNAAQYKEAVLNCQKHIREGDIYQANICHEFEVKLLNSYSLSEIKDFIYSRLRLLNPAKYMAIAEFTDWVVFSSSPESLLKIELINNEFELTSSPIKGTVDIQQSSTELRSEKEIAEHIMIVDLIRNDLGKISKTGSVKVINLLKDSKHTNLQHLISDIQAKLKTKLSYSINETIIPDFEEIFNAIFPGGSITGAPKIRSMKVIDELEPKKRALYTGSLGYYKFNKYQGEFNILIRSVFYNKKTQALTFNTGAGITSASDPEKEYSETLLKAQKLIEVFNNEI